MKFAILLILVLYVSYLSGASSERITRDKVCESKARWAAEVFDLVKENPKVILSGMEADDVNAFAFIRAWVKDGKTREELKAYVVNRCAGVEV